jgi:hypothetical protein
MRSRPALLADSYALRVLAGGGLVLAVGCVIGLIARSLI